MNLITSSIAAAYLGAAGITASFAIDFARDYSTMNTSILKSIKTGDIEMNGANGAREQIAKACASSSVFLASQGHTGVSCDAASGTVKF